MPTLTGLTALQSTCLAKKSKTCILLLSSTPVAGVTGAYGKLVSRPPPHTFQVFHVPATDELAAALVENLQLGTELPQLVAVNHRGWFRRFAGDAEKSADVLAWLDAVKMGEGSKGKVPDALMAQEEGVGEKVREKVEEVVKSVEEEVEEVKEKVEEKVEDVKEAVEETVEDVKEKVEEKVADVKDEL